MSPTYCECGAPVTVNAPGAIAPRPCCERAARGVAKMVQENAMSQHIDSNDPLALANYREKEIPKMSQHTPRPVFTRGHTPYWTYPCGCAADALRLTYCPLHAAAPELLAALEDLLDLGRAGFIRGEDIAVTRAVDAARAAIAKAKGESK